MNPNDILELSLPVQAALGGGYMAYVTAYAGWRHGHPALDTLFLVLAFAIPGALAAQAVALWGPFIIPWAPPEVALAGALVPLVVGVLWRRFGRPAWHWLMRTVRIHTDDGIPTAWAALSSVTQGVSQIDVHLNDGQVFRCEELRRYKQASFDPLVLGQDGSVIMVVEFRDSTEAEREPMLNIVDPQAGTRLTYIPASLIARVDLRIE